MAGWYDDAFLRSTVQGQPYALAYLAGLNCRTSASACCGSNVLNCRKTLVIGILLQSRSDWPIFLGASNFRKVILAQISGLKPGVRAFKSVQRLQRIWSQWIRKLFGMLDREPDTVYGNSGMVGHLEFDRRRSRLRRRFGHLNNLVHHARSFCGRISSAVAKRPPPCKALRREFRD